MSITKIVSSYKVEILKANKIFEPTVQIYRDALSYCVNVLNGEWEALAEVKGAKTRFNFAERLLHSTKDNMAKYDFDIRYPKMPSYLRRAVIQAALGAVSSYRSNLQNWEDGGCVGKEPKLQSDRLSMPTFYNKEMYAPDDYPNSAFVKLYHNNDWVWVKIRLRPTDVRYLRKYWSSVKASAPTLEKRYGRYYLRFAFTEWVDLSDTPVSEQRICAVDLGLNTDAVCSIMAADGTVLARKFVNFPSEKDHLYRVLNRIKRKQREHGPQSVHSLWNYAKRLNDELARKVAAGITDFAVLYSADCIVFEHLDFQGKKHSGSKAQRLSLWKRNYIQDLVEHKAHRCGIRISRICAWGTSKLAFDGSGVLTREDNNRALATFQNGKRYNCDLNASYNIGARYFIREILKPLPETVRSRLQAEVPAVGRRTSCTLDTLLRVTAVLAA